MSYFNSLRDALKKSSPRGLFTLAALFAFIGLIWFLVWRHVLPTGLDSEVKDLRPNQYYRPARTLWDWLQLAGIPVALAFIAYLFQAASKKSEQKIALENQRNDLLQKYVDAMSELILSQEWKDGIEEYRKSGHRTKPQIVARARTQVALGALQSDPPDSRRRGQIIRFLLENQLLQQDNLASPAIIDLRGTDLRGVDLARAHLSKADLSGVDLTGADLKLANLKDIIEDTVTPESRFRPSQPYATKFDLKWLLVLDVLNRWKPGRDLTRSDFRDAYLGGADFGQNRLCRADFRGANLANVSFRDSDLRGADFRGAVLDLADLAGTRIDWRTRLDPKWKLVRRLRLQKEGRDRLLKSLGNADLSHAYLFYASMPGAVLDNADLSNAVLEGAWLQAATFSRETRLLGASFENAHLECSRLDGCYLMLCNLKGAKLNDASLIGAYCSISQMDYADLTGARLNKAELWDVSLVGANLEKADFTGAKFKEVNCAGANLRDSTITPDQLAAISNLTGAILPDGTKHP